MGAVKHRARVWKERKPYARHPWRAQCSCMTYSGLQIAHDTHGQALEGVCNHMRRVHGKAPTHG